MSRIGRAGEPPSSIVMLSGDVHHCYLAEVGFRPGTRARSRVWQAVCSAFRKELAPHEQRVIAFGHSVLAERLARRLARAAGVAPLPLDWRVVERPAYANQIATLTLDGEHATLAIEAIADDDWRHPRLKLGVHARPQLTLELGGLRRRYTGRWELSTARVRRPAANHRPATRAASAFNAPPGVAPR